MMEQVLARHRGGDLDGALALCREIVAQRPDMPAAWLQMAILQRKRGDMTAAIDALGRLIALNPEDGGNAAVLGQYLTDAGRAGEAVALLRPYAAAADPSLDVLVAQGVALARLGRLSEAATALERARRADPSNAMARVELGTVRLLAGQDARAREAFEEALRLDPGTGHGAPLARPRPGQAGKPGPGAARTGGRRWKRIPATWTRCCRWGRLWPGAGRWTRRVFIWSGSWRPPHGRCTTGRRSTRPRG